NPGVWPASIGNAIGDIGAGSGDVVVRASGGRVRTRAPAADNDAVNLGYLNGALADIPKGAVQSVWNAGTSTVEYTISPAKLKVLMDTKLSTSEAGNIVGRDVTISTDDPSGGNDGDIWFKVI